MSGQGMGPEASDSQDSKRDEVSESLARYERQWRFAPIGLEGQRRIAQSRVLLIGCGALGSVSAEMLVRAGVGYLRIVDRDFLEWNNLQRQSLYTEADVERGWPKAITAAENLRAINRETQIEPIVGDVTWQTLPTWLDQVDLIVDGTDNFETRFLINDACCEHSIPWVFAGCLGAEGQAMTIVPGRTACLRCLMPEGPPAPGDSPTCDAAGILASIIHVMASIQVTEGLKILVGDYDSIKPQLTVVDLWRSSFRSIDLSRLPRDRCPTCCGGERLWLSGARASQSTVLCGRQTVQISLPFELDLHGLSQRFEPQQIETRNPYLLRLKIEGDRLTLFRDGRVLVSGETDPQTARSIVARRLGM